MSLRFEATFLPESEEDLEKLDPPIRNRCLRKIEWLSGRPELLGKKPLKNLPYDLKGLCSYPIDEAGQRQSTSGWPTTR